MQASLTADDIYVQILFLRTVDKRAIVLVEGDTDCAIIDSHLDTSACDSMPSMSKTNAVEAAGLALTNGLEDVVAIVDRDWVGLLDQPSRYSNVFYTDKYDMEITLFGLPGVRRRILNSHCERNGLRKISSEVDVAHPTSVATRAALAVATFRYCSRLHGWKVGVRDFPVHAIMDLRTFLVDLHLLCRIAGSRSKVTFDEIAAHGVVEQAFLANTLQDSDCQGHDLMNSLSYVINQNFSGRTSGESLAAALRSSIGCDEFSGTKFYSDVSSYAAQFKFKVWACPCS